MSRTSSSRPTASTQPYLDWWGLTRPPFQLEPDARFAFDRGDHREGLARMLFGLTHLGGIVAITGEVGCGKTMLARALDQTLAGGGFTVAGVANPPRSAAGVLAAILAALGAGVRGGGAAKLAARVRSEISGLSETGRRPVIVIDEAQRLDPAALEEVRLLTNPGDGPAAPVVLLGQPQLGPNIAHLPQVAQRVVVRYHLSPMDQPEVAAYVQHRVRVGGATRRLFSSRAEGVIHGETGGIPRLVNLLCANALFVGFVRRETQVGEDLVRDLAEDRAAGIVGAET